MVAYIGIKLYGILHRIHCKKAVQNVNREKVIDK
jgi:hypothetical protein